MCLKDMINDVKSYELDRSVNARMAISKYGDPIKAVSMHRSCSTPLWKIALVTLSFMTGVILICHLCKKCRCKKEEE